jgi:excisionase family DNA binding protein
MATKKTASQEQDKLRLLTKEQLAAKLQLSTRTVYRKWQDGEIPPPIKLGSVVRWRSDVIEQWIENDCQGVS